MQDIQRIQSSLSHLFYVGPVEGGGLALFARQKIEIRPMDPVKFFVYNGLFRTVLPDGPAASAAMPDVKPNYTLMLQGIANTLSGFYVSGVNFASLMVGAPSREEFAKLWELRDSRIKMEDICFPNTYWASDNLFTTIAFADSPVPAARIIITNSVGARELMSIHYGPKFWNEANQRPWLYFRNGKPLPKGSYSR